MQLSELAGTTLGEHTVEYDDRTTILYALCCGATEIELVWEERLVALPTLATALGLWAVERAGTLGAYDRTRSLHVGQALDVRAPLPPSGRLTMRGSVDAVYDKGKAAIVEISASCDAFTTTYTIFLPGMGGFGGDRGPQAAAGEAPQLRKERTVKTPENLALLYRLTGDRHPIHVDPEVAKANGFQRPILHGLCTLGVASYLAAVATGNNPTALRRLAVRLGSAVTPGDDITVRAGTAAPGSIAFDASTWEGAVIRDATAEFAAVSTPTS